MYLVISGTTEEQHLSSLSQVFDRFKQYDLRINLDKSRLKVDEIGYLGY